MTANQPEILTRPLRDLAASLADADERAALFQALRTRRDTLEPKINAFELRNEDIPDHVSGPLNGLPITVKDQIAVAGLVCTSGLDRPGNKPDLASAKIVTRFQEKGAAVTGKTVLPPHAMDFQTYNRRRGRTNNPYDLNFTAGGSSGGGAAAVASGMSVLDLGADLSGSLRVPAAWCGVASLTPGEGAWPTDGMLSDGRDLEHFGRVGPIARNAADLAFAWDCVSGDSRGARDGGGRDRVRIWMPDAASPCDAPTVAAWLALPDRIADAGVACSRDPLGSLFEPERYRLFGEIMGYETGAFIPPPVRWLMRRDKGPARKSPGFLAHVHAGYRRDKRRHADNLGAMAAVRNDALSLLDGADALVLPVTGICAFRHIEPSSDRTGVRDYDTWFDTGAGRLGYFDALTRFTVPTGLLGWPVVTLPVARDPNGLPIGAQFVGRPGGEQALLELCAKLESRLSWCAAR